MEKSRVGATQASIGTIKTRCSPSTRVKRMAIGGLALPFGIEETTRLRMLSKRYYASKSFRSDRYNQDQVFSIDAGEEDGHRRSGIAIWDRGDYPITDALEALLRVQKLPQAQQEAEWNKFAAS